MHEWMNEWMQVVFYVPYWWFHKNNKFLSDTKTVCGGYSLNDLTMYQLKALFKTHLVLILIIFCAAVVLSKYKNEKSTTDV